MQDERVRLPTKVSDDYLDLLSHQAADEVNIAG
jgi:hypothetical protein